jgi:hypothetical protein
VTQDASASGAQELNSVTKLLCRGRGCNEIPYYSGAVAEPHFEIRAGGEVCNKILWPLRGRGAGRARQKVFRL